MYYNVYGTIAVDVLGGDGDGGGGARCHIFLFIVFSAVKMWKTSGPVPAAVGPTTLYCYIINDGGGGGENQGRGRGREDTPYKCLVIAPRITTNRYNILNRD